MSAPAFVGSDKWEAHENTIRVLKHRVRRKLNPLPMPKVREDDAFRSMDELVVAGQTRMAALAAQAVYDEFISQLGEDKFPEEIEELAAALAERILKLRETNT